MIASLELIEKSNGFEIVDLDAYGLVFNKLRWFQKSHF